MKPYRVSFWPKAGSQAKRISWVRYGTRMDQALVDAKRAAKEDYPKAHGFNIESSQGGHVKFNPSDDIPHTVVPMPISQVRAGDIIIRDGELKTLSKKDIKKGFMGITLWGDSYKAGKDPVMVARIHHARPKKNPIKGNPIKLNTVKALGDHSIRLEGTELTAYHRGGATVANKPHRVRLRTDTSFHRPYGLPDIDRKVRVNSLEEASAAVRAFIGELDIGASNWGGGEIYDSKGNEIAYVSYNGRIWEGSKKNTSSRKEIMRRNPVTKAPTGKTKEVVDHIIDIFRRDPKATFHSSLFTMSGYRANTAPAIRWLKKMGMLRVAYLNVDGQPVYGLAGESLPDKNWVRQNPNKNLNAQLKASPSRKNPSHKGKTMAKKNPYRRTPINKSKAIPKGKRAGERFTKEGKTFVVISYVSPTGKRVRYARRVKARR